MKRVLLGFLLMSITMSSMAWAWGGYADVAFGFATGGGALSVEVSMPSADDHDTFHEHYCNHGAAHLIGLPSDDVRVLAVSRDEPFFGSQPTIVSEITTPPSKPPRL